MLYIITTHNVTGAIWPCGTVMMIISYLVHNLIYTFLYDNKEATTLICNFMLFISYSIVEPSVDGNARMNFKRKISDAKWTKAFNINSQQ